MQLAGRVDSQAGVRSLSGYSGGSRAWGAVLILVVLSAGLTAIAAQDGSQSSGEKSRQARSKALSDARRAEVVFPKGRVVIAEIADTPEKMQRGYMFREQVGEEDGMIFVYPSASFHAMWMKNTLVPLDMVWMDVDFRVVHIERSVPPCRKDPCPAYGSLRRASYVLEVQGGSIAPDQLALGDRISVAFPQPD